MSIVPFKKSWLLPYQMEATNFFAIYFLILLRLRRIKPKDSLFFSKAADILIENLRSD